MLREAVGRGLIAIHECLVCQVALCLPPGPQLLCELSSASGQPLSDVGIYGGCSVSHYCRGVCACVLLCGDGFEAY